MKRLSLSPDVDMRWLYDHTHPDYNTDRAKHLRAARAFAINGAPEWMKREAELNDLMRRDDASGSR